MQGICSSSHWQLQYDQHDPQYCQITSSYCRTKSNRSLLESALTRTRESLEKLLNQVPEATPQEHYGCFSAALLLDIGQPLTNLAVYTDTGVQTLEMESLVTGDGWQRSAVTLRLEVD